MHSSSSLSALFDETIKQEGKKLFREGADWRIITSGVVTRPLSISETKTECVRDEFQPNETTEVPKTEFLISPSWTETLRKPTRFPKSRKKSEGDSNNYCSKMTRNCEQLFSQMKSTFTLPSQKSEVDPSFSVRRIVKGSGLLQAFGTGLLNNNEPNQSVDYVEHDNATNSESPPMFTSGVTPFDVNAFMTSTVSNTYPNNIEFRDQNRSRSVSPDNSPMGSYTTDDTTEYESTPKNSPKNNTYQRYQFSPVLYDTVLMQKTIETKVVEYLPLDESDSGSSQPQCYPTKINKLRQAPVCDALPVASKRLKRSEIHKLNNHAFTNAEFENPSQFDETEYSEQRSNAQFYLSMPLF